MPCEVSSRRWSCLHRCRECLSRSHLRCVQHDGPADKPPIGDLLPRLGSSIAVALLLLIASSIHGEEETTYTYTCAKHTLKECFLELPCSTFKRESNGDIVPTGVKIRLAGSLDEGEFNQRDFNRAAEEKCGKLQ